MIEEEHPHFRNQGGQHRVTRRPLLSGHVTCVPDILKLTDLTPFSSNLPVGGSSIDGTMPMIIPLFAIPCYGHAQRGEDEAQGQELLAAWDEEYAKLPQEI
ncbi:hypothetical protein ANN_26631 [Periplaneta americana]|uniref:Per a allergen n=1 Tax=Periplaneta americana TaxID=6978 RepID=A0ABQ8RYT8_PERAM|nr:hypothetical protein ANN_26631 [Periplaneta americana]